MSSPAFSGSAESIREAKRTVLPEAESASRPQIAWLSDIDVTR